MLAPATVIHYLDDHAGAFTALLTLVLIAVTAYYALQNRHMVAEMAATRELSILPKLAVDLNWLGPNLATAAIKSVGPGPAMDIDVRLVFEPAVSDVDPEERRWRQPLLVPGGQWDFFPPGEELNAEHFVTSYESIRLVGSLKDATGKRHEVDEAFSDLPEWWGLVTSASGSRDFRAPGSIATSVIAPSIAPVAACLGGRWSKHAVLRGIS